MPNGTNITSNLRRCYGKRLAQDLCLGVTHDGDNCEQAPDDKAEFFSVYLTGSEGASICIADLPDRTSADDLAELLFMAGQYGKVLCTRYFYQEDWSLPLTGVASVQYTLKSGT